MGIKRISKRAAGMLVGGMGLAPRVARLGGKKAAILAYHRVLDPALHDLSAVEPGMYVTKDTFSDHLELLLEQYRVLSLSELVRYLLTGEEVPRYSVVLTFDDGWRDNFESAYPLLLRHGLPATIFVPSALIGTDHRFWFSRATVAAAEIWRRRETLVREFPEEKMPPAADFLPRLLVRQKRRSMFLFQLVDGCKDVPPDEREEVVAFLEMIAGPRRSVRRELVNWDELRRMAGDVFEVGSHGANHLILTEVDAETANRELVESRRILGDQLGRSVTTLCYPDGAYDDRIVRLAGQAGYACAVTTEPGFAHPPVSVFSLPRIGVHQDVARDADGLALLLAGLH